MDLNGKWDVKIHVYNDRGKHPYGILVVTDRKGNEVYRMNVKVTGVGGRDRKSDNADTPLGAYKIDYWGKNAKGSTFGPGHRLFLTPYAGEIKEFSDKKERANPEWIRLHGDDNSQRTGNLEDLKDTEGCIRGFNEQIKEMKEVTDNLEKNDQYEKPGFLYVIEDLVEKDGNYSLPDAGTSTSDYPEGKAKISK